MKHKPQDPELRSEVLAAGCVLMRATIFPVPNVHGSMPACCKNSNHGAAPQSHTQTLAET